MPTIFVSIEISSVFDMVDHNIVLNSSFGISDTAFSWICSYIRGRLQCVAVLVSPHLHIKVVMH